MISDRSVQAALHLLASDRNIVSVTVELPNGQHVFRRTKTTHTRLSVATDPYSMFNPFTITLLIISALVASFVVLGLAIRGCSS